LAAVYNSVLVRWVPARLRPKAIGIPDHFRRAGVVYSAHH
jgi:hypothetical protein